MAFAAYGRATVDWLVQALERAGYGDDITWSEGVGPPETPEDFALEAAFVICNSGMKNTVARRIFERIVPLLEAGQSARGGFGHKGKAAAIDKIWAAREDLHFVYMTCETDAERLEWLAALPWIGGITKFHLAKNFGVDVAKPDVHLQRLAELHGETAQSLCERLAAGTPFRARTIDLLLWRACAIGLIDSRTGELSA